MSGATYKSAGVDLDVYEESMRRLPKLMHRTFSPRVMKLDGGFAGLFKLDFANKLFARNYEDPVLVSCTDGVGTKLRIARLTDTHNSVGIDLVAMSVNDAICCGAEPLFFLDYIAMSHDDPEVLEQLVEGISNGCLQADCALIGGETAIMSDMYAQGDYDMAGFCVGVVDRKRLIDGSQISKGDVLIGVASSGLHSNGFSLVRKVVFEMAGLGVDDHIEELGDTVGNTLLTPTRIYAAPVRKLLDHYQDDNHEDGNVIHGNVIHGIAHITGGGLEENLSRILPKGLGLKIDEGSWDIPPVFDWLQKLGGIAADEMKRVFNMGLGLVLVVSSDQAADISSMLSESGMQNWQVGEVISG